MKYPPGEEKLQDAKKRALGRNLPDKVLEVLKLSAMFF